MQHGYSQTPINDTVMNILITLMQFVIIDTHNSNATGLSLQSGYIYEHYEQAHLSRVINE